MGSPNAIPIRLPTTLPFPSTSSKAETPSSSSSQPRPRPHKQQAQKPASSIASGEQNSRRDPAVAQRNKQKKQHKKNLKKVEVHKTKQATSAPSPQSAKPHPKKQKTKQFQHPNQKGKTFNDGPGAQRAKSASQGPSTPQPEKALIDSRSGSASPARTLEIPTPIREADGKRSVTKPSPSRGVHRREIEGNIEIQDEAGKVIDIGQHGPVPDKLNTLIREIRESISLASHQHVRMVHVRPGNRVVPIFDAFDWTYFLERLSVDPTAKQVLQAQIYSTGPIEAPTKMKRKREESVDSEESPSLESTTEGDAESYTKESATRSKGSSIRRRKPKRPSAGDHRSRSSDKSEMSMDSIQGSKLTLTYQGATPSPEASPMQTDSGKHAPESPSPAPRLLANIGHQFKPHRPSPLSRPVILPPPSVSSGASSSRESSPDVLLGSDSVMEDMTVVPGASTGLKQSSRQHATATPTPVRGESSQGGRGISSQPTIPGSPDVDDVAKAVAGLAALLPDVTATLSSLGSPSSTVEADSSDEDIGNDTVLDESGITQAEAARAYEVWKNRKAADDAEAVRKKKEELERQTKKIEAKKLKEEFRIKKVQEKERKKEEKLAAKKAAAAYKLTEEKAAAGRRAVEEATKRLAEADALRRRQLEMVASQKLDQQKAEELEKRKQADEKEKRAEGSSNRGKVSSLETQRLQNASLAKAGSLARSTERPEQASSMKPSTDTESDTESEDDEEAGANEIKTSLNALNGAEAPSVPKITASVVVAPASQVEQSSTEPNLSSASSSSSSNDESSDDDDDVNMESSPAQVSVPPAVPSTAARLAHLPSSSPEPYSDDEEPEDEAPRKQSQRRRTQRSPSTDALIPEGDDDDDDDASSIDATQPLVQMSQVFHPSGEEIESADEPEAVMDVDIVEDFPLPTPATADEIVSSAEVARRAAIEDPDATDDEVDDEQDVDEQDDDAQSSGKQAVDEEENESDADDVAPASPAVTARSQPESPEAMDVVVTDSLPTDTMDTGTVSERPARRSFAELADEVEASASAVPSTGNQALFRALQTEADGDRAALETVISERQRSEEQTHDRDDVDQLVPDEAAEVEESQSSSIPDSTPTPAPLKRRVMPSRNSKSAGSPSSESPPTLNSKQTPPARAAPRRMNPAVSDTRTEDSQETAAASQSSSQPKSIAPLPKRRGRPSKSTAAAETVALETIPVEAPVEATVEATVPFAKTSGLPSEWKTDQTGRAAQANSQTVPSSQPSGSQEVIGSSVSPQALLTHEPEEAPPSPSAAPVQSPALKSDLTAHRLPPRDPREEARIRRRVGSKPCIICEAVPSHLQMNCPVVTKGLASIEGRIAELQAAGGHMMAIEALKGWQTRLDKSSQNLNKLPVAANGTPSRISAAIPATANVTPSASPAPTPARVNGLKGLNGVPSPGLNGLSARRRATVATRNNIPTLSSLKADALRKPRLSATLGKEPATTPVIERPSPFRKRGADSDDDESSSGSDSDSDDGSKGPTLPPSLAGRMANSIKSAKKAVGW